MFLCHLSLEEPDIVPPHNFEFQLDHYVFPPEQRYGDCLVEVVRLAPGLAWIPMSPRGGNIFA
jgi:hypothetical protein